MARVGHLRLYVDTPDPDISNCAHHQGFVKQLKCLQGFTVHDTVLEKISHNRGLFQKQIQGCGPGDDIGKKTPWGLRGAGSPHGGL